MRVLIHGIDSEVSSWSFEGGDDARVYVGADPRCDWHIRGMGIGRRHLELAWFDGNLWVRALAEPSGRELAVPGEWVWLEPGTSFDLGAARVTAQAARAKEPRAPWDTADGLVPTVISKPAEVATVITSCAAPSSRLDELPPVSYDRTGQVGNHTSTAIVQPSQLRQWAAAADVGSQHQVLVSAGQASPTGRPTLAAQRLRAAGAHAPVAAAPQHRAPAPQPVVAAPQVHAPERFAPPSDFGSHEHDSVADVFAMPPPVEAPPPAVAKPPLWETLWWAIPGRAVMVVSAIAALVCFVWFPRLLSAQHEPEGVQAQQRTIASSPASAPVSMPLPTVDEPFVATPELAEQERAAAAALVAGDQRKALDAYRLLVEQAPDVPAYVQMVRLLERRVSAPAACNGRTTRGGRCVAER